MESNLIKEALKKWLKTIIRIIIKITGREIGLMKDAYTAGTDFGYKKGIVDTLVDIKKMTLVAIEAEVCVDGELLNYIDTELKKAGE